MPTNARGYFVADPGGQSVLGIKYRDLFPCGHVVSPAGEMVGIAFVLTSLTDTDHDYHGEHCEVPDSSPLMADFATKLRPDNSLPYNPILYALYQGAGLDAALAAVPPSQAVLVQRMLVGGLTEEQVADRLSAFASCHYLGRTATEVRAVLAGWTLVGTDEDGNQFDTFNRCSLEEYGE